MITTQLKAYVVLRINKKIALLQCEGCPLGKNKTKLLTKQFSYMWLISRFSLQ